MPISEALLLSGAALAFAGRSPNVSGPVGGFVWPLPRFKDGRAPVVSDGWGSPRDGGGRRHRGADIMYKRPAPVDASVFRVDHGSKLFELPGGVPVLAARAGKVWSAGQTERGGAVVIDHGKPYATFYQHLEEIFEWVKKGASVRAGQPIGIAGYSPIDSAGIRHLHFELWVGGAGDHAVDVEPHLRQWPIVPWEAADRSR